MACFTPLNVSFKKGGVLFVAFFLLPILTSCSLKKEIYRVHEINRINKGSEYLKAHMKNGELYILKNWSIDEANKIVTGKGAHWSSDRSTKSYGDYTISIEEVALFETNVPTPSLAVIPMAIITGLSLATTFFCISNPKACFGSCPTFYVYDGEKYVLEAEGFTESILPSFEKRDIDALFHAKALGKKINLYLTNEALETHILRYINLLLVPLKTKDMRVFKTVDDRFFEVRSRTSPHFCSTKGCLEKVRSMDRTEWFDSVDQENLLKKDEIILKFKNENFKKHGLILSYRQTLLTTYLFYQHLAYMGNSAGYYLSKLNSSNIAKEKFKGLVGKLGGIEVYLKKEDGEWSLIGKFNEMGPIALNTEVVLLPEIHTDPVEIKLKMTKGLWRIDYVSLGEIKEEVTILRIRPSKIYKDSDERPDLLNALLDEDQILISMPGDKYELIFDLPDEKEYEFFLETKGYYIEWLRDEWLKEENPEMVLKSITSPEDYFKSITRDFKAKEGMMEEIFWNSRYEKR